MITDKNFKVNLNSSVSVNIKDDIIEDKLNFNLSIKKRAKLVFKNSYDNIDDEDIHLVKKGFIVEKLTKIDPTNNCDIKFENILNHSRRRGVKRTRQEIGKMTTNQVSQPILHSAEINPSSSGEESTTSDLDISVDSNSSSTDSSSLSTDSNASSITPPFKKRKTWSEDLTRFFENLEPLTSQPLSMQPNKSTIQTITPNIHQQSECFILPLPYQDRSYMEAIKFAYTLVRLQKIDRKKLELVLNSFYQNLKILSKEYLRQSDRDKILDVEKEPVKKRFFDYFDKLMDNTNKFNYPTNFENSLNIKIFEFSEKCYKLSEVRNENEMPSICLYKKQKTDGSFHYDLLISRDCRKPFGL